MKKVFKIYCTRGSHLIWSYTEKQVGDPIDCVWCAAPTTVKSCEEFKQ